jgi:uncharacterized DUF497 family protein
LNGIQRKKKHGISFDEAKTLFYNEYSLIYDDPDHSEIENRFIIVGFSSKANLLLACFCERSQGNVIRIFSARKLTKQETKNFNKGKKK